MVLGRKTKANYPFNVMRNAAQEPWNSLFMADLLRIRSDAARRRSQRSHVLALRKLLRGLGEGAKARALQGLKYARLPVAPPTSILDEEEGGSSSSVGGKGRSKVDSRVRVPPPLSPAYPLTGRNSNGISNRNSEGEAAEEVFGLVEPLGLASLGQTAASVESRQAGSGGVGAANDDSAVGDDGDGSSGVKGGTAPSKGGKGAPSAAVSGPLDVESLWLKATGRENEIVAAPPKQAGQGAILAAAGPAAIARPAAAAASDVDELDEAAEEGALKEEADGLAEGGNGQEEEETESDVPASKPLNSVSDGQSSQRQPRLADLSTADDGRGDLSSLAGDGEGESDGDEAGAEAEEEEEEGGNDDNEDEGSTSGLSKRLPMDAAVGRLLREGREDRGRLLLQLYNQQQPHKQSNGYMTSPLSSLTSSLPRPWLLILDADALPSGDEQSWRGVMQQVTQGEVDESHEAKGPSLGGTAGSSRTVLTSATTGSADSGGLPSLRRLFSVLTFEPSSNGAPGSPSPVDIFNSFLRDTSPRHNSTGALHAWIRGLYAAKGARVFSDFTKGAYRGTMPVRSWLKEGGRWATPGQAVKVEYMPKHEPYFIAKVR